MFTVLREDCSSAEEWENWVLASQMSLVGLQRKILRLKRQIRQQKQRLAVLAARRRIHGG